jgi:hypothetical protein
MGAPSHSSHVARVKQHIDTPSLKPEEGADYPGVMRKPGGRKGIAREQRAGGAGGYPGIGCGCPPCLLSFADCITLHISAEGCCALQVEVVASWSLEERTKRAIDGRDCRAAAELQ